jgi:hypothetical protein
VPPGLKVAKRSRQRSCPVVPANPIQFLDEGRDMKNQKTSLSLGDEYDSVLVGKVLCLIESHNQAEAIDPDLISLRNTMLAISALLHLQVSEIGGNRRETFAEAASCQLDAVSEAARIVRHKN